MKIIIIMFNNPPNIDGITSMLQDYEQLGQDYQNNTQYEDISPCSIRGYWSSALVP